ELIVVADVGAPPVDATEGEVGDSDKPRRALTSGVPPRGPGRFERVGDHRRRHRGTDVPLAPPRHAIERGGNEPAEHEGHGTRPRGNRGLRLADALDALAPPDAERDPQVGIETLAKATRPEAFDHEVVRAPA